MVVTFVTCWRCPPSHPRLRDSLWSASPHAEPLSPPELCPGPGGVATPVRHGLPLPFPHTRDTKDEPSVTSSLAVVWNSVCPFRSL